MAIDTLKADFGGRRFDLDWVRIVAFMLLILYHVGMYYVDWDWHVKSPSASSAIEPLMMLTSPWRLSLLFLVSGVATAYLLARAPHNFLSARSVRLLIPLAFGMLVIVPPQSYFQVVEKLHYSDGFAAFYRLYITAFHGFCSGSDCLILPTWNHLWFVAYLFVYTVVLYAAVRLMPKAAPALRHGAERVFSDVGVLIAPIVYLAAARLALAGRFPANGALIGDWYNHATYFGVFALGFILAATRAPWQALERLRWQSLALAVLGWASYSAYMGFYSGDAVPSHALIGLMRVVYGAEQWLGIAAALGFARRHLNRDNAARRYLTTAIFPVYILHQTVIVVVAHSLKPAHLYPPIEALMLVAATTATCFLGYEIIRRVRPLQPLFGLAWQGVRRPHLSPRRAPAAVRLLECGVPQDLN